VSPRKPRAAAAGTPATTQWLSAKDIAARLSVSRTTAFELLRRLPHVRIGRIIRVSDTDFAAFLAASMRQPRQRDSTLETQLRSANALLRSYEAEARANRQSGPQPASKPRSSKPATATEPPKIRLTRQPPVLPFPDPPSPIRVTREPRKLPFP
jgi:excisionase family DNA binding protein